MALSHWKLVWYLGLLDMFSVIKFDIYTRHMKNYDNVTSWLPAFLLYTWNDCHVFSCFKGVTSESSFTWPHPMLLSASLWGAEHSPQQTNTTVLSYVSAWISSSLLWNPSCRVSSLISAVGLLGLESDSLCDDTETYQHFWFQCEYWHQIWDVHRL